MEATLVPLSDSDNGVLADWIEANLIDGNEYDDLSFEQVADLLTTDSINGKIKIGGSITADSVNSIMLARSLRINYAGEQ